MYGEEKSIEEREMERLSKNFNKRANMKPNTFAPPSTSSTTNKPPTKTQPQKFAPKNTAPKQPFKRTKVEKPKSSGNKHTFFLKFICLKLYFLQLLPSFPASFSFIFFLNK